jgi:hypothetical protein
VHVRCSSDPAQLDDVRVGVQLDDVRASVRLDHRAALVVHIERAR